ncbi:ArsS family sensor histidine kinase [Halarcobacter bivalviorum]|uniref:histidine kinase n=1 Tax=Halarcobacter bivalviorum TaxID=663364 RepID=A0AAX2A5Q6_9BACT|nr:ArsS family sensor histidine kinase [Halarcobacter bivalviorum]AXH11532.1 two-component system sensor histidine kinase [Halarcobacter bivalviorum]RXK09285.1 histidine kinase [Halarcobacter bivalviorum]
MNRQSLFFTVTVTFIISLILVVVSFIIIMIGNQKRLESTLFERYQPLTKMVYRQHHRFGNINEEFKQSLEPFNYDLYLKKSRIDSITYNPNTKVIVEKRFKNNTMRVLQLDNRQFLYLNRKDMTFLVEDKNEFTESSAIYIILIFAIILITLILSFLVTLRKLMPLKILKDKVSTLGDENFDFECCNTDRKDEVSLLALEFKKSAKKLKELKEARNIFIRNIMHELKTPITKGKFLTEIQRNEENDAKLKEVFNRLEALINEFASIEELISSKNVDKKIYFLNDILDNAKDILMIDEDRVIEQHDNLKLEVNFKLFSIAIKNLLDNAIKYSKDKKVTVRTENDNIIFENSGEALAYDLEKYYEPFFANEQKTDNSFGLGLYIVHNILKANAYDLEYKYENEKNIFICKKEQ